MSDPEILKIGFLTNANSPAPFSMEPLTIPAISRHEPTRPLKAEPFYARVFSRHGGKKQDIPELIQRYWPPQFIQIKKKQYNPGSG